MIFAFGLFRLSGPVFRAGLLAARFDVSIASAVHWYPRYQRTGSIEPAVIGGDRQSHQGKLMRRGSLAGLMSEET